MPSVQIGDASINYEVSGQGKPLILITGMGGLASYWKAQISDFSKHFRVYTFDHRGTGRSTHSEVEYSVELLARDTVAFMDALDITVAHFVGHSTGGMMLQVISSCYPERVLSQVLYGTRGRTDAFSRRAMGIRRDVVLRLGVEAYVRSTPVFLYPSSWIQAHDEELVLAEEQAKRLSAPPTVLASRIDAVLRHDQLAALKKIDAPTLVTCALDDFLTPVYYSEELARLIPNATLSFISHGGHACSVTNPGEFNKLTMDFLCRFKE